VTRLAEDPSLPARLGWLAKTHDAMGLLEEWAGMILLALMAIVVNLEIFARYVFDRPFIWTEEVTRLTLVWLTFIAVPALIRRGGDMAINTFTDMLPPSPRRWAHVFRDVLMLLVYALVAWQAFRLARAVAGMPLVVTDWPTALLAWPLVIGSALVILHVSVRLLRTGLAIRESRSGGAGVAP
jgi:TRAP-type C4-dicarboxylate transport system permease small subunit